MRTTADKNFKKLNNSQISRHKNVLYISYDGMTDPLGQSQVIPYLAGLTKSGYRFTILSCEKPDRYKKDKEKLEAILANYNIKWHPILYTKRPPVISTLYDYYKLKKSATALHKKIGFSTIHCRSYISALIGQWMKKNYAVPFIFDMRGFWADERVDGKLWNLKNPLYKSIFNFFKKKELQFLNESDSVVCLTNAAKLEILKWKGLTFNSGKIEIIPCCVDTQLFNPAIISKTHQFTIKQKIGLKKGDVVIGYLGSIGTWYMIDEMMQFFSALKKSVQNARFLFVTHSPVSEILNAALKNGVDVNDILVTEAARAEVPAMISIFDYGLFFIKASYSKKASSPTKQGEIMAMGVPVICNSGVGDTDKIINDYNAGVILNLGNLAAEAKKIPNPDFFNKNDIRYGAEAYFSLNKGVSQYLEIYSKLISSDK